MLRNVIVLLIVLFAAEAQSQPPLSRDSQLVPWLQQTTNPIIAFDKANKSSFSSDTAFTLLGRWAWGPCNAVALKGEYAFIGNGGLLQVLDIRNPSVPRVVFETSVATTDIQIRDSLAFVCNLDRLLVFDISNPTEPRKIGEVISPGGAHRVRLTDSLAILLGVGGHIQAVDISDPRNPRLRGNASAGGYSWAAVFVVKGRHIFTGSEHLCPCPVRINDATNPDSIRWVTDFWPGGIPFGGTIVDSLLVLGVPQWAQFPSTLRIYNIRDPSAPQLVSVLGNAGGYDLVRQDSIVYSTLPTGVAAINIADPSAPRVLSIRPPLSAWKLALDSHRLVVDNYYDVAFMSVAARDSLQWLGEFRVGGEATRVALRDSLAFVASGRAGMWIVNTREPSKPTSVGNVRLGGGLKGGSSTWDVAVDGNYAYAVNFAVYDRSDPARGLWVIDIANPNQPQVVAHHIGVSGVSTAVSPKRISKVGNLVINLLAPSYSAPRDTVLEFVDVTNPTSPQQAAVFVMRCSPNDVAAHDSLVFLASSDSGLTVLNISNPKQPRVTAQVRRTAWAVALEDTILALVSDSIVVFNMQDPIQPIEIGKSSRPPNGSFISEITMRQRTLYWGGVVAAGYDLSDPRNPSFIGVFDSLEDIQGVSVSNDVVACAGTGISLWRNNRITSVEAEPHARIETSFRLLQNYPNPFNSETSIEFVSMSSGEFTIEVFDVLGRMARTVQLGKLGTGRHRVRFDASALSSGVYWYRLRGGGAIASRSMVIIR